MTWKAADNRRLIFSTVLLLIVGGACAQHAGLNVQIESVRPRPVGTPVTESLKPVDSPLESILNDPQHSLATGAADSRELYKFNVEWGATDNLSVTRKAVQTAVTGLKGRPFERGVRWETEQGAVFTPFAGTSMSFSEKTSETIDLADVSLGATKVQQMGLTQEYGSGSSAGNMAFSRKVTRTMAPTDSVALAPLALTQTTVEENLALGQGFSMLGQAAKFEFKRNMTSVGQVDQKAQNQTKDTLSLAMPLWAQMNFTGEYSRTMSSQETALQQQTRSMSFTRKFNSGDAAIAFSSDTKRQNNSVTESRTQKYQLPFRFDGTVFSMAYDESTVKTNEKLMSDVRNASFATKVGGNDVTGNWSRNMTHKSGKDQQATKMAFSLPINFFDEKIALSYTSEAAQADTAVQTKHRIAKVAIPLSHFQKGASFDYVVDGLQAKASDPLKETRTAKLILPLNILNTPVTSDFQRITTRQNGKETVQFVGNAAFAMQVLNRKVETSSQVVSLNRPDGSKQDQFNSRLTIPTKPGNLVMARNATTETAANGTEAQTTVMTLVTPRVPLNRLASLQGDLEIRQLPKGLEQNTSHLNMQLQPMKPLTLAADYRVKDLGTHQDTKDRQVDWAYKLSPRLDLNGRYLEREQLDKSPYVQRTMVVQRKNASPSDLQMKAALTSTDDGTTDGELLKLVNLGFGDPKKLGVTFAYQEYDEKKLTSLGDPTIQFGLTSGDPSRLYWQFGFQDSQGRADPARIYNLALPIGDTAVKLAFNDNAALSSRDTKDKTVRMADTYDASLTRKMFDALDMSLSYRYLDYADDAPVSERTDQWLEMSLKGGDPMAGGSINVAYRSGDFTTLNKAKPLHSPDAEYEVSYSKKWAETGVLTLTLNRTDAPDAVTSLKDSYNGAIKFDREWNDASKLSFQLSRSKDPNSSDTKVKDNLEGVVEFSCKF